MTTMDIAWDLSRKIWVFLGTEEIILKECENISSQLGDIIESTKSVDLRKVIDPILEKEFLEKEGNERGVEAAVCFLCSKSEIEKGTSWAILINALRRQVAFHRKIPQRFRKKIKEIPGVK